MNTIQTAYQAFCKQRFPLPSEVQVVELEHRLGIPLPADYRRFLLDHNGGFFNHPIIMASDEHCPSDRLTVLAGTYTDDGNAELALSPNFKPGIFDDNDPPQILPIGLTELGSLILLMTEPGADDWGEIVLKLAYSDKVFPLGLGIEALFARLQHPKAAGKIGSSLQHLRELGCKPRDAPVDCNLESLEAAIGARLPAGYREFLLNFGGWWGAILCPNREPTPFGNRHWLTGFYDAREVLNFSGGLVSLLDVSIMPKNFVAIGYGDFEKYTGISIAGPDRGSVYAVDGEVRSSWTDEEFKKRFNAMGTDIERYLQLRREHKLPEKQAGYEHCYFVATNFEEFLSLCSADTNNGDEP